MSMTNEQIQALKAAAEDWATADERYNRAEITIKEYIRANEQYASLVRKPAAILSLLAERDADKVLIAELKNDVDAANARVDAGCAQLCNQDEEIEMLRQRIAELEDRTLTVKLPERCECCYSEKEAALFDGVVEEYTEALESACAAAGITLVVGE